MCRRGGLPTGSARVLRGGGGRAGSGDLFGSLLSTREQVHPGPASVGCRERDTTCSSACDAWMEGSCSSGLTFWNQETRAPAGGDQEVVLGHFTGGRLSMDLRPLLCQLHLWLHSLCRLQGTLARPVLPSACHRVLSGHLAVLLWHNESWFARWTARSLECL